MKRTAVIVTLPLLAVALTRCGQAPQRPDFSDAIQVDSGQAVGVTMSAYTTTMIADGSDEALIRMFVTDSAGREIMNADDTMRIDVEGDATIAAADGYSVEPKTDDDGTRYWETQLVDGVSAVILVAGTSPDRVEVRVRTDSFPPSGHQIHTIPADVELKQPTETQVLALQAQARSADPMIGADISWLPQLEARGTVFRDSGVVKDPVQILADNGLNAIRLRVFVDPSNPEGYSPDQGFCDLDHTLAMARRAHDAGMKLLLNFHYSDYWADPQQQNKPLAWQDLSFDSMKAAMQQYTTHVIRALAAQGTPPAMVQVGNEINHGLLWPDGHISHLDNLAELLKAGVAGVREADSDVPVMMHLALGGQNEEAVFWLDNMIARGLQFDVIGLSYYPRWHGTLPDLYANTHDLVERYGLPVDVVEYGWFAPEIHQIVFGLPDHMGQGTFIWEPLGRFFDRETGEATDALKAYNQLHAEYLGTE